MRIYEIESYFEALFPSERRCGWDNDGLLVCPDRRKEVRRVLTCLDVTFSAIEKARLEQCDLIISHHPLLFTPVRSVNEDTVEGQKILLLLESGISLLSLHTRFDGAVGGLNVLFAKSLGILPENTSPLLEEEPFIGGIGSLPAKYTPDELARHISRVLGSAVKLYSAEMNIERVGYCCGSGKDLVRPCLSRDVDAFVGGDIPYHTALEAVELGMSVIDCGHFASEKHAPIAFRNALNSLSPELEIIAFSENTGGEVIFAS